MRNAKKATPQSGIRTTTWLALNYGFVNLNTMWALYVRRAERGMSGTLTLKGRIVMKPRGVISVKHETVLVPYSR